LPSGFLQLVQVLKENLLGHTIKKKGKRKACPDSRMHRQSVHSNARYQYFNKQEQASEKHQKELEQN
jgi:hypothetical protein